MRSASALAWRNLTGYPLRSVLTALAIVLGVGMVLAAAIVGQAASQGAADLSDRGPRTDLEVFSRGGGTYERSVLHALAASPDVARVSSSLRVEAELVLRAAGGGQPNLSPLTLLGIEPEAYRALHDVELAGGGQTKLRRESLASAVECRSILRQPPCPAPTGSRRSGRCGAGWHPAGGWQPPVVIVRGTQPIANRLQVANLPHKVIFKRSGFGVLTSSYLARRLLPSPPSPSRGRRYSNS